MTPNANDRPKPEPGSHANEFIAHWMEGRFNLRLGAPPKYQIPDQGLWMSFTDPLSGKVLSNFLTLEWARRVIVPDNQLLDDLRAHSLEGRGLPPHRMLGLFRDHLPLALHLLPERLRERESKAEPCDFR